MTPPIAFDPSALLEHDDGGNEHVEIALEGPVSRGRWRITIEHDDGRLDRLTLRPAFMAEILAQARAREADAA